MSLSHSSPLSPASDVLTHLKPRITRLLFILYTQLITKAILNISYFMKEKNYGRKTEKKDREAVLCF